MVEGVCPINTIYGQDHFLMVLAHTHNINLLWGYQANSSSAVLMPVKQQFFELIETIKRLIVFLWINFLYTGILYYLTVIVTFLDTFPIFTVMAVFPLFSP